MVLLWRHSEQLHPSVLRSASWFRSERVTSCVMVLIFMFIFPMFSSCTYILSSVCYFLFYFEVFPSALCVSSCFALPSLALFPPHVIVPERFTCTSLTTSCVLNFCTLSCSRCFLRVSSLCFLQLRFWHSALFYAFFNEALKWRAQPGILALRFKSLMPKC